MSIKIKIHWDNENAVFESVQIYRSDSIFTPANLPAVLEEIVGDVYEYEDLDISGDQTYFYMLSAKLGEREVFTECYKVETIGDVELSINGNAVLSIEKGSSVAIYNITEPVKTGQNLISVMLMSQGANNLIGLENWNNVWSGGGGWGFRIFWKYHEAGRQHTFRKSDNTAFRADIALLTFECANVVGSLSVVANSVALSNATSPITTPPIIAPQNKPGWEIAVVNRPIVNTSWKTTAPSGYIGVILEAGSSGTYLDNSYNRVSAVVIKKRNKGEAYTGTTFEYTTGTSFAYGQAITIQLCAE